VSDRLEHIVVLMLENRSFDHMCGFLKKFNSNIDGLNGTETCPYNPQDLSQGTVQVNTTSPYVTSVDPSHSWSGTKDQIFGYDNTKSDPAPMNGFVYNYFKDGDTQAKGADVMKCFDPANVPAISALAQQFAIFDHWYSSVPGPTQPNRLFLHSCTSLGSISNDDVLLAEGYPQKTIYDSLYESGVSWRSYFHDFPSVLFLRNLHPSITLDGFLRSTSSTTRQPKVRCQHSRSLNLVGSICSITRQAMSILLMT